MHPRFYFCTNYEKCIQVLTTKNIKNIPIGTIAAMNTGVVMETTITTASTENIMIVQSRKLSGSLLSMMSISLENLEKGKQELLNLIVLILILVKCIFLFDFVTQMELERYPTLLHSKNFGVK